MSSQVLWYATRAAGIVSWVLLTASTLWGLLLSTKLRLFGARPSWMLDLHRFLGGLAVVFVGVHVGAILLDTYTSFGLVDVLVPLASSWHPVAVAWGVLSLYVLLAVELTSLARRRLPNAVWRRTHYLSFPLFLLATLHFATAGTDAGSRGAILAMCLALLWCAVLVARRVALGATPRRPDAAARPRTPVG